MQYRRGVRPPDGEDDLTIVAIQLPGRLLRTGAGRCLDSALLTVATLRALGIPFIIISDPGHAVGAAIVKPTQQGYGREHTMKVRMSKGPHSSGETMCLAPLDLAIVGLRKTGFDEAVHRGKEFLRHTLGQPDADYITGDGEMFRSFNARHAPRPSRSLWYRPTAELGTHTPSAEPLKPARRQKK